MNEQQFRALCVPASCTVRDALDTLDRTGRGILLVTGADGRLVRTVTDGDLRRAALARVPESATLGELPAASPLTLADHEPVARAVALMDQHLVDHIPVIDAQGLPLDLVTRREMSQRVWLSSPHLGEEETAFVEDAFRTNWIAPLGPHVDGFERELAAHVGVGHAAALSSGTAAIHLGLLLLGVQPGDTVFCSSLTFVGSCNPILYCGARPVFIDSEPQSWNMSPQALERAFEWARREGRMPRCVVLVNLYGQSADMDALLPICERYGVPVLEDAAESLGAQYKGRASGAFGRVGVFSFNGNKIITTSGGGMLVADDADLVARARKLSTQAREPAPHYEHVETGFNYRMSNVLAGIGRGQLRVLGQRVERRRAVFEAYRSGLADLQGLHWMPEPAGMRSTRWLTCLALDGPDASVRRDRILRSLERHSIEARPVWKPMHLQPLFRGCEYFPHALDDDVSARLFAGGLCLPSGSNMPDELLGRVIEHLRRALAALAVDVLLGVAAWWIAFWLRFNLDIPPDFERIAWGSVGWCVLGLVAGLVLRRVDRHVWTHTGLLEMRRLAEGVALGGVFTALAVLMLRIPDFPRSVLLLQPIIGFLLMGLARAAWRTHAEGMTQGGVGTPLVVVGTIDEASEALRALRGSSRWRAVGILSPLRGERGRSLQGVRVLGTVADLPSACQAADVRAALVASPPGSVERREALLLAAEAQIPLMTLPRPDEWLRAERTGLRKVELEDLLGRDPVELDVQGLAGMLSGQTVLVTGAGGSIGSELCRQIARFGAARLVCVDVSEFAIYQLEQELRETHPQMRGIYYTANVREPERLRAIMQRHVPAVVFHAAAYKHVPLMEQLNEVEALRTNVIGTLHAARIAGECGAQRFVMISTDKAVNPTNVMGASKRLAELLVQSVAAQYPATRFVSVRFGNVLGSSGSVVPLFTQQIARGGPVTVTHPDIVRYFMTIPEAAQLVLQAALMGESGQIFVLDMGEPVRIVELARMLIRLSGHTEQEIPVTFTGLRPGEKLFEELLADDETTLPTPHPKLRVAKTGGQPPETQAVVEWIERAGPAPGERELRVWLQAQVPEYQPR